MRKYTSFFRVKIFLLLGVIVILFGLLLYEVFQLRGVQRENWELQNRVHNQEKQIAEKEEEVKFLIQDQPRPLSYSIKPYSFKEFGIYSPLLEGKDVSVSEVVYKRCRVRGTTYETELDEDNHFLRVSVTHYLNFHGRFEDLIGESESIVSAKAGACEPKVFFYVPVRLSELAKDWQDVYVNPFSIKMYWFYEPKHLISSVNLAFWENNSPDGSPIYVEITLGNISPPASEFSSRVLKAKRKLLSLAETVRLQVD